METSPMPDPNMLLQLAQQRQRETQPALMQQSPNPVLNHIRQQSQQPAAPPQIQHPDANVIPPTISAQPQAMQTAKLPARPLFPQGTLEGEQNERNRLLTSGPGVSQIYGDITNSRLGQAHPVVGKLLGGLAQGLGSIGDIALSAASPKLASLVPGTSARHAAQLGNINKQIGTELGEQKSQAETAHAQSQAALENAQTPEVAPDAAAKRAMEEAQAGNLRSETNIREHPLPLYKEADKVLGPHGEPVNFEEHTGQYSLGNLTGLTPSRAGAGDKLQHVTFTDGTSGTFDPLSKPGENYRDSAGRVVTNPKLYEPPQGQWFVTPNDPNNPQAGSTVNRVGSGGHIGPNAMTPAGDMANRRQVYQVYQPASDSAERMNVMADSYEKAISNKEDQQAMINLLSNHLGMTMGLQKGARMNQALINEAMKSQPFLSGLKAKFGPDGWLTGVTLSPQQMRQMMDLAQVRYREDFRKSEGEAQFLGAGGQGPPRTANDSVARMYLVQNGRDPKKAREAMQKDGWTF